MKLRDAKVGLDGTQFPRLIFQEHPQLFQSGPERMQEHTKKNTERKGKSDKVKKKWGYYQAAKNFNDKVGAQQKKPLCASFECDI